MDKFSARIWLNLSKIIKHTQEDNWTNPMQEYVTLTLLN